MTIRANRRHASSETADESSVDETFDLARRWMDTLSDDDWFVAVEALPPLHAVIQWHSGALPGRAERRRMIPKLRKHVKHLSDQELAELIARSFVPARQYLLNRGHTENEIEHPNIEQLDSMLDDLPATLSRLALLGLLAGGQPASALALQHRPRLLGRVGLIDRDPETAVAAPAVDEPHPDVIDHDLADRDLPTAEVDDETVATPETPSWTDVRGLVARLREEAVPLAARLREDATSVESGRLPADAAHTASVLTDFAAGLEQLLGRVSASATDRTVMSLDDMLRVADAADERADRQRTAEQLVGHRTYLLHQRSEAGPAMLDFFDKSLADVDRKLAALGPVDLFGSAGGRLPAGEGPGEPSSSAVPARDPDGREPGTVIHASAGLGTTDVGQTDVEPVPDVVPVPVLVPSAEPEARSETGRVPEAVTTEPEPVACQVEKGDGPPMGQAVTDLAAPSPEHAPETVVADVLDGAAAAEAERLAFPWDAGDPPAVVELVSSGLLAEAYWVTAASDESQLRADVLRLALAAFAATDADAAGTLLTRWNVAVAGPDVDRDAFIVELVALLRCGLAAGWSHRFSPVEALSGTIEEPWLAVLAAAADVVQKKGRLEHRVPLDQHVDLERQRADLGIAARQLRDELPRRKTKYQRATLLLPVLLDERQPLGALLDLVISWATATPGEPEAAAAIHRLDVGLQAFTNLDAVTELINKTDAANRSAMQRERIHSGALRQLERVARQVIDRGREAVALAKRMIGPQDGAAQAVSALGRAATLAAGAAVPAGVGGEALDLLARWVREPANVIVTSGAAGEALGPDVVSDDALLVLPDLPRDERRRPDVDDPDARFVLARLTARPDPTAAVARYCSVGALDLADRLREKASLADAASAVETAAAHWRVESTRLREEVQRLFERVRMQNLLTEPAEIARVQNRLAARTPEGAVAHDVRISELKQIHSRLQSVLDRQVGLLRAKARMEVTDTGLRARVEKLLDEYDVVTANEFLAAHLKGERIEVGSSDPVGPLRDFLTGLQQGIEDPADPVLWAELFRTDRSDSVSEAVGLWLADWTNLRRTPPPRGAELTRAVQGVLRLVGLDVRPGTTSELRLSRQFVTGLDVEAEPRDGSIIAELGSKARGRYRVIVVRDERRGRSPLDDLDATVDRPTIVLSMKPLTIGQRAEIADNARSRRLNAVVVDPAVMGFVAARAPSSFRLTQQVTLPWTGYRPYRPFVAGLLPKELFVGRESERREIVDPDGAIFVYGGRQLGKSALLHQIQADAGANHVVVYLDVQSLGRAHAPDRIWVELAEQLKRRGVVRESVSSRPGVEVVQKEIRRWLAEDGSRRILLLADEADAFLTADSHELPSAGGAHNFPTVNGLKQLMESTDRRFKFVFTGLHQVQRFVRLSNVPTPHGGSVLIGPLETADAYRLVVEPIAALGYTFEQPELVWRLLAHTNFHPAPIQIICSELLTHLRRNQDLHATIPVVVTAQDVDRTASSKSVRDPIAERTRITFNLEDRYRILAMLIARKSLDDDFSESYPASDLLEEAADIWPAGFGEGFDEDRLAVYLDEMVGLGLLVRSEPRAYEVRSPNVVSMLGTRQYFERELRAADFENAYEYHPGSSRRLLSRSRGADERSPLTDAELQRLVAAAGLRPRPLITGSPELAIDRLPDALRSYLDAEDRTVSPCGPAQLKVLLSGDSKSAPGCIVLDLRDVPASVRKEALDRADRGSIPVVVLVAPDDAVGLLASDPTRMLMSPLRWSVDSVRAWPDCPYDTPDRRKRLIAVTGGWPKIVEAAVRGAQQQGETTVTALEKINELVPSSSADAERVLRDDIGIDADLVRAITFWAGATAPGEAQPRIDLPSILSMSAGEAAEVEERLRLRGVLTETSFGVALDELTHRCLNRIASGG